MFVYEKIDDNWLQKIKEYNFTDPLYDKPATDTYWYINHETNEALYYIGCVTSAILRAEEDESLYEFAYIYQDKCMPVTAYIFLTRDGKQWDDKNKMVFNHAIIPELSIQILQQNIKGAIIVYLENIWQDRKKVEG